MPLLPGTQLAQNYPPGTSAPSAPDHHLRAFLRAVCEPPTHAALARIESLARDIPNYEELLDLAARHRVLPLVYTRLTAAGASIPSAAEDRLRDAWQRNVLHCTANAAELSAILQAFERSGIPALPFKGVVLAASAYGDLAARNAGDIDILIRLDHLLRATEILLGRGFDRLTPVREDGSPSLTHSHEYHFERASDGMVVELRWRLELTQPRYRRHVGMQWLWPHHQSVRVAGADLPSMDPETSLIVLCMHGSKHTWSRLIWISDVAHLLAASPTLDWSRVNRDARRLGLRRALALGVLLAHRVCSPQVPAPILSRFERLSGVNRLAHSLEELLFHNPGQLPSGRIPYNLQILGLTDRLYALLSLDLLRPNHRDLAFVRLPRSLHLLYFFIRPLRILRDRSAR